MNTLDPKVKAIETHYNGYRFRSRLEARWAVFFDALGARYEYEKEGFSLPSGPYLPDFWLPEINTWVEIKGKEPSKHEKELCKELAIITDSPATIFHGLPFENSGVIYAGNLHRSGGSIIDFDLVTWKIFKGKAHLQLMHPLSEGELEELKVMSPSLTEGPWERIVFGSELRISGYEVFEDGDGDQFYSNKYHCYPVENAEDAMRLSGAVNQAKSARFEHGERGI